MEEEKTKYCLMRENLTFRLHKRGWNERIAALLTMYNKKFVVREYNMNYVDITVSDCAYIFTDFDYKDKRIECRFESLFMVLVATLGSDCNRLNPCNFAIEKTTPTADYVNRGVIFLSETKMTEDPEIVGRYRSLYPIEDELWEFYKMNKCLIEKVYDNILDRKITIPAGMYAAFAGTTQYRERKKPKLFLSVPISGLDEKTVRANVADVKERLLNTFNETIDVVTPFEICGEANKPYSWYMGRDIEALLESDVIVSLERWRQSKGCRCERCTAEIYDLTMTEWETFNKAFSKGEIYAVSAGGLVRAVKLCSDRFNEAGYINVIYGNKDPREQLEITPFYQNGDEFSVLSVQDLFGVSENPPYKFCYSLYDAELIAGCGKLDGYPVKFCDIFEFNLEDGTVQLVGERVDCDQSDDFMVRQADKSIDSGVYYFRRISK